MKDEGPLIGVFLSLLRSGLYSRPLSPEELPPLETLDTHTWVEVVKLARQQSVAGLIYFAITLLPDCIRIPGDIVLVLMADAEEIRRGNRHKALVTDQLMSHFRARGLEPLVMKGLTVARYYPDPELRHSGDIDLYLPKDKIPEAVKCLTAPHPASDGSIHSKEDGVDIDLHDRYFDIHCRSSVLPNPGTPEATILMLSAHILKHAIGPGVGIRQLCDLAVAWQALKPELDPSAIRNLFNRTGTYRWNRLLFSFLEENLGLSGSPFEGERIQTGSLKTIILEGGNFGHHAEARKDALRAGNRRRKLNTLSRFLKRIPFSIRYSPRETFATVWTLIRGNMHF
ncbi:MAG: nucleotidyltransferase family protein [Bacteroidales bacterium]|nr:nucleotidyltransferase family protein [Bacteroidales bacterium]